MEKYTFRGCRCASVTRSLTGVGDNSVKADVKKFMRDRMKGLNDTNTVVKVSVFVAAW